MELTDDGESQRTSPPQKLLPARRVLQVGRGVGAARARPAPSACEPLHPGGLAGPFSVAVLFELGSAVTTEREHLPALLPATSVVGEAKTRELFLPCAWAQG